MQLLNPKTNKRNILPIFAVATFALHLLTFLVLMFHWSLLRQLGGKLPQSFVQLADGRAIAVNSQDYLERHPQTIRRMVGETMTLMFTLSEKQPQETVWQISSELLGDNVLTKFKSEVSQINSLDTTAKNAETLLVLRSISQPEKIAEGQWQVEIIGDRLIFSANDKNGTKIPFNKKIFVRATDKPKIVLPDAPTPLHLAVYRLGEAKLEIYNLCDIKDKKC